MYTFCPNCFAVYQVTAGHLGSAGGKARCGECRQVYLAVDYLFDELDDAREALELQRASGIEHSDAVTDSVTAGDSTETDADVPPSELPLHPARPQPDGWQQRPVSVSDMSSGVAYRFFVAIAGLAMGVLQS